MTRSRSKSTHNDKILRLIKIWIRRYRELGKNYRAAKIEEDSITTPTTIAELEHLAIEGDAYLIIVDKETFLKAWDSVRPENRLSNSQVIHSFVRPDKAKQRIVIELNVRERIFNHEAKNVIDISRLKK